MSIEFDLAIEADRKTLEEIESQFDALPKDYPDHVTRIHNKTVLDEMLACGRLSDEMSIPPPRPTTSAKAGGEKDTVTRIKLKVAPLHKALSKAEAVVRKHKTSVATGKSKGVASTTASAPAALGVELELVWESKPLTRRDLTVPDGENTHATGSINLDKGLLPDNVDHRSYFRDNVFSHLTWSPRGQTVDEAFAKFQLVLKGISYGEFDLAIRHSNSKTSKSYLQKNAMTRLSWGPMGAFVARPDLIGRTLALYRDKAESSHFVLEID